MVPVAVNSTANMPNPSLPAPKREPVSAKPSPPPVAKRSPPALSPGALLQAAPPALSPKSVAPTPGTVTSKPNYPLQDAQVATLSTSKVWVLPPRPKPGRKPSTDTPPTKRKAQNRAAQRAFRERRAARINELEEMLADVNQERDEREQHLHQKLNAISEENNELRNALDELRRELRSFSSPMHTQSYGHEPVMHDRRPYGSSSMSYPPSMNQMASPPTSENSYSALDRALEMAPRAPEAVPETVQEADAQEEENCMVCTKDDCLCVSIGIKEAKTATPVSTPAQSSSSSAPLGTVPLKRRRTNNAPNLNPFKKLKKDVPSEEVDFTAQFAKPPAPAPAPTHSHAPSSHHLLHNNNNPPSSTDSHLSNPSTPIDKCGFCADGTPCLCAEAAADESSNMADIQQQNTLPPLFADPSTPKPNEKVRLPSLSNTGRQEPNTSSCTGNPGTCSQCQADPMSTLFCTTLASHIEDKGKSTAQAKSSGDGCCGGSKSGGAGGCCKDKSSTSAAPLAPTTAAQEPAPGAPGSFIPCSAAYQTLSRHKDFSRANLGQLVGKLYTRGMQVEVSSVANVLRELDRRLYQ